jgi:hypothetical protein
MKWILLLVLAGVSLNGLAQLPASGKSVKGPITTKRGIVLKVGDNVRCGEGGLSTGAYQYIYSSFDKFEQKNAHLEEGYSYKYASIREFREVGSGDTKRYVALVRPKGGINVNYKAVDLEPAMDSKEIISVNDKAIIKLIVKKPI